MNLINQQEQAGLVRTQVITLSPQSLTYLPKGFFCGSLKGGLASYPKNAKPVRFLYIQPTPLMDNRASFEAKLRGSSYELNQLLTAPNEVKGPAQLSPDTTGQKMFRDPKLTFP